MDNLSLLANLPNHVNGKHLNVYRWLDGCGWSIDVQNIIPVNKNGLF